MPNALKNGADCYAAVKPSAGDGQTILTIITRTPEYTPNCERYFTWHCPDGPALVCPERG